MEPENVLLLPPDKAMERSSQKRLTFLRTQTNEKLKVEEKREAFGKKNFMRSRSNIGVSPSNKNAKIDADTAKSILKPRNTQKGGKSIKVDSDDDRKVRFQQTKNVVMFRVDSSVSKFKHGLDKQKKLNAKVNKK